MTTLHLHTAENDLYLPKPVEIIEIKQFNAQEKFFKLKILDGKPLGHVAGQFVQVSILGIGEAPISVSSPPSDDAIIDLCVRAVGEVTNKLHTMDVGDLLHIRGPFGHGFDQEILDHLSGKHVLFVAGGIGYVPLRSLINQVVPNHNNYKKVSLLYGCRSPDDRTYHDELDEIRAMGGNVELLETVDRGDDSWTSNVGVITTLIPMVDCDPKDTVVIVVGPPIMYKFVLASLKEKDILDENIYVSLERRMKCGVGKCGHCQMGDQYVCQTGPVYKYEEVKDNTEVF